MEAMTDKAALHRIAVNTRRLREAKGLSMAALARLIDDYPATIKRIEDESNMPGLGLATRLADALGVELGDLLEDPKHASLSRAS
jgi:transcriptional regulator with XRE-family HTH domain